MGKYLKRVILVALACLIFTAVNNANLGIVSQLASQNDNLWIGPLSIGLIFLGSGLGALYHGYMQKYSYNKIIFTGGLGWDIFCTFSVIFLFLGFQPYVNAIIIIGSLICGIIVSVFYNGIFNYFNECGKRDRKTKSYFGISMCIQQSANLLGGGISSLFIEPLGQRNYSLMMLGLGIASSLAFIFLKEFPPEEKIEDSKQDNIDKLISEKNQYKGNYSLLTTSQQNRSNIKIPKILFFTFAMSGVMINFVYSVFSVLFYQFFSDLGKEQLNRLTFIALMIEGCGQFAGGLTFALFSKNIKNIMAVYTANNIFFLMLIGILYIGFQDNFIQLIYLVAFFIGFCDCFCFSLGCSIGGHWKESGISLFNAGQSVTVALLSIPTIFLNLYWIHLIYFIIFIPATISIWIHRKKVEQIHLQHE